MVLDGGQSPSSSRSGGTNQPAALPEAMLRVRISAQDAHYAFNLVSGATVLALYGDVLTELCIRHDGEEGLLRAYESVEFLAPILPGDYLEIRGRITSVGQRSRGCDLVASKVIGTSAEGIIEILRQPQVVSRATATVVVNNPRPVR